MPDNQDSPFRGYVSPNYTQVPDVLFDEQLPDLSGAELKVLLYIMRRTFGFKKDADNISLNQISRGITTHEGRVLDRGTGLSKSTVQEALKGLTKKRIVLATKRASQERGFEATTYSLNLGIDPYTENRHRGAMPEIGTALYRKSALQETGIQQTDFNLSKFRKASSEKNGTKDEIFSSLEDGSGDAERVHRPPGHTGPPPDTSGDNGREIVERIPLGEAVARWNHHRSLTTPSDKSPTDNGSSPTTDSGFTHIKAAIKSTRGRPRGTQEERERIRAYLADFMPQLNDQAPLSSSITRALNLFKRANVPAERWDDYLYQARSITKENLAKIQTKIKRDGTVIPVKNQAPYFFAVLEDLLHLRDEESTQPEHSAHPS